MLTNPILALAEAIQNKQSAVLATVVEARGASPAKAGSQMALLANGTTLGTVGGGKLEAAILADADTALHDGAPKLAHYRLTEEGPESVGTLCGGEVLVFIQPYLPPAKLVIVGGGHIGRPLRVMAEAAGFDVVVVDVEPGRADLPELKLVNLTETSYVVVITTDHVSDEAALRHALTTPAVYIGMIGSLHKCETILSRLRADGFTEASLERIYAPIGFDLGGPTPEEISVAILAEVIAVRRGGKGGSRSR